MKAADKKYIWELMPGWIKEQPEGLFPTMYGTLSREGDIKVRERVERILNI